MALARARVSLPNAVRIGEIVEIKTIIRHPMETGYRVDNVGRKIPRHIVENLRVTYDGAEIFAMDMTQGVAANPFVAFTTVATRTGEMVFTWTTNRGESISVTKTLTVSA